MIGRPSTALPSARREGVGEEPASLFERAKAARHAARGVQDEAREIVARCVDGPISRENDRREQRQS